MLIHAAAGGVGIAATQIAKRAGAEVWGTASPGKHEAIRGFGVDHADRLHARRAGSGRVPKLDLVMDAIGGASFRRSYKLLRAGRTARLLRRLGLVSARSATSSPPPGRCSDAALQPDQADGANRSP